MRWEHTKSKRMREAYSRYLKSKIHDISECYTKPSQYKYDVWVFWCSTLRYAKIISYNTFCFTVAGFTKIHGKDAFVWITQEHNRYIYLDELD